VKIYRTPGSLSWTIRGKSGELGAHDHIVAKSVRFATRKRSNAGYAEALEAVVVADTRLLDGRIVLRDGVWVFDATGREVTGTLPMVVFNRLGAFVYAGAITPRNGVV
jgi:hypothetical protein